MRFLCGGHLPSVITSMAARWKYSFITHTRCLSASSWGIILLRSQSRGAETTPDKLAAARPVLVPEFIKLAHSRIQDESNLLECCFVKVEELPIVGDDRGNAPTMPPSPQTCFSQDSREGCPSPALAFTKAPKACREFEIPLVSFSSAFALVFVLLT